MTCPSYIFPLPDQPISCATRLPLSQIAESWPSLGSLHSVPDTVDTVSIYFVLGRVAAEFSQSSSVTSDQDDLLRLLASLEDDVRTWSSEYISFANGRSYLKIPGPSSGDDDEGITMNWPSGLVLFPALSAC